MKGWRNYCCYSPKPGQREKRQKDRQNKKRETHGKAILSKPSHISSNTCLTHSLTHIHSLVIESVPHTYSKHSWWSRSIHSPLPPLPGSCQLSGLATVIPLSFKYPWHMAGPYHLDFRGRGAQQHHCCLWDRAGSTGSLYTPVLQLCGALAWLQCTQKCWRMFWERDKERETPSEAKIEVTAETSIGHVWSEILAHLNKHRDNVFIIIGAVTKPPLSEPYWVSIVSH